MINKLVQNGETISRIAAWISGVLLFGTAVMISIEVVLRKVFSISMGGADEISGYAMAISCSWAFAFALFRKAHIRIDVLYVKMPKSARYLLDIFSLVLFAIYMVVFTYFSFHVFLISFVKGSTANTPLHTPLWIPQSIWVVGLIIFTLSIFLLLAGTIYNLLSKNFNMAQQFSGVTTLEEEIEEETVVAQPLETALTGGLK